MSLVRSRVNIGASLTLSNFFPSGEGRLVRTAERIENPGWVSQAPFGVSDHVQAHTGPT